MELIEKNDLIQNNIEELINKGIELNKKVFEKLNDSYYCNMIASRTKAKYTCTGLHKPENVKNKISKNNVQNIGALAFDMLRRHEYLTKKQYKKEEKQIILMKAIFPNDELFMELIAEHNTNNIFIKYQEEIEKIQYENKNITALEQCRFTSKFIRSNIVQIQPIYKKLSNYLSNNQIETAYNRLLQIKYLNENLYIQYKPKQKIKGEKNGILR